MQTIQLSPHGVFGFPEMKGLISNTLMPSKVDTEFRKLRSVALQYDYWKPETVIVEAKASGLPLTYELRKMNIPVVNFTPSKGNDKHARVNAVAPLFESGMIWAPEQKFTEEVIENTRRFHMYIMMTLWTLRHKRLCDSDRAD